MRTGLIAKKIGMSNYYTPNGVNIPVTVLHIEACKVIERVTDESSKLDKLLVGADEIKKLNKVSKSVKTYFEKKNMSPFNICLLYTSPSPRDATLSRMPSSA